MEGFGEVGGLGELHKTGKPRKTGEPRELGEPQKTQNNLSGPQKGGSQATAWLPGLG